MLAKEQKDDDPFKINGRMRLGFDIEKFKNGEAILEAKIKFKSKRKLGTKAVISLATDNDQNIFLEDAYLNKKLEDSNKELEIGRYKKRLGLEWQFKRTNQLSVHRTYIYKKLEEFTFVGRETLVKLIEPAEEETNTFGYEVGVGYNDSTDSDIILFLHKPFSGGDFNIGNWSLIQYDNIDQTRQIVWTDVLSFWSYKNAFRYELELFSGIDPYESEFEKTFGDDENVQFYAAKLQLAYGLWRQEKEELQPYLHLAYYVHDADSPNYNTQEAIVGINYMLSNFKFSFSIALVGTNSKLEPDERNYDDSVVSSQVSIDF